MRLRNIGAIFIICLFPVVAFTWDDKVTHKDLSEIAANKSVLGTSEYLKNIGLSEGLLQRLKLNAKEQELYKWIRDGAELEDAGNALNMIVNYGRSTNHFHNPLKPWTEAGLSDALSGKSSLVWAQDGTYQAGRIEGDWSWQKVRSYYYLALTATADATRQEYFARTFRGIGHQIHLIQDKAVPYHVRNDAHPLDSALGKHPEYGPYFETWAKENYNFVNVLAANPKYPAIDTSVSIDGYAPITQFSDVNSYDGSTPSTSLAIGLSEYTNANFMSDETIFTEEKSPSDKHYFPYPRKTSTNLQDYVDQNLLPEVIYAEDGQEDVSFWIKKDQDGEVIEHFVKPGYFFRQVDFSAGGYNFYTKLLYLDEKCHEDYAKLLIPRAVGYSAGLLNYFFRGTLEITQPDRCLYGIIDGAVLPQQFTQIKAKVRNTTPNETIQAGILQAVARYRKRTDYEPGLSTDPPTAASRETYFSYSVSAPITLAADDMAALNSTTPKEFTFSFAASPIPAGVTDLYLQVIFKGTLGNEADTAVAVGMKDIGEPQHHVFMNTTDRFYLDGVLRTADEIKSTPALLARVDHNGDGVPDELIDPHSHHLDIFICPVLNQQSTSNAFFVALPAGRFGKIITLTDAPPAASYSVAISWFVYDAPDSYVIGLFAPRVMNQDDAAGVFKSTQVYPFRGIAMHAGSAYSHYYPDSTGIKTAPWPAVTDTTPWPAYAINP